MFFYTVRETRRANNETDLTARVRAGKGETRENFKIEVESIHRILL